MLTEDFAVNFVHVVVVVVVVVHTATYFETRQDFWRHVSIELTCKIDVGCFMIVTKYVYKFAWRVQR